MIERARIVACATLLLAACAKSPQPGGASSSSGATTTEDPCPKDEHGAVGKKCGPEGRTCATGAPNFTHLIMCNNGKWIEMEAPPPPPPPQ